MKNTFDLKEIQKTAIKLTQDHPYAALLAMAIAAGISKGISKLRPTIEKCWKYTVDKAIEHLPNPATQASLADDNIIDVNVDLQQTETDAA